MMMFLQWKRPNPKLTNATKREERVFYRHLPRRSRRIKEVRLQAIRLDSTLSPAQKKWLLKVTKRVITRRAGDFPIYSIGDSFYKHTAA
jgi:hypothetical protein